MPVEQPVQLKEYTLGKLLGRGAFAQVYAATKLSSKGVKGTSQRQPSRSVLPNHVSTERYAIKRIEMTQVDAGIWSLMHFEADLMLSFHHPNVLQALEVGMAANSRSFENEQHGQVHRGLRFVDIVTLQFATTLEAAISRFEGKTPASVELLRQLTQGIRYLHCEHGLAHMDIKPANVLLDGSSSTVVVCPSTMWLLSESLLTMKTVDC